MNKLLEDLEQGLQEAIDYEKGKGTAKKNSLRIAPVKKYTNIEIKSIGKEEELSFIYR